MKKHEARTIEIEELREEYDRGYQEGMSREFGPLSAASDAELSAHKHEQYAETIRGLFSLDRQEGRRLVWVSTAPPNRSQQSR